MATATSLAPGVLMIANAIERTIRIQKIVDIDRVEPGARLPIRIECHILRVARRHLEFVIIATKLKFRRSFVLNSGPVVTSEAQDGIR